MFAPLLSAHLWQVVSKKAAKAIEQGTTAAATTENEWLAQANLVHTKFVLYSCCIFTTSTVSQVTLEEVQQVELFALPITSE